MLSTEPGARFEVELPARWSPCPQCASNGRTAVAFARRRTVALFCGGPEPHRLPWIDARGQERTWIGGDTFAPGGAFAGLLPARFFDPASGSASPAHPIGRRRKEWIYTEQPACAGCSAVVLRDWYDGGKLLAWLRSRHPAEYDAVLEIAAAPGVRLTTDSWYAYLARADMDLIARINFRIEDSCLHAAHSLPAEVIAALWPSWPCALRRLASNTLAFGFCRRCCRAGAIETTRPGELVRRHVTFNADGSIDVARADAGAWSALLELVHSVGARVERR